MSWLSGAVSSVGAGPVAAYEAAGSDGQRIGLPDDGRRHRALRYPSPTPTWSCLLIISRDSTNTID